MSRKTVGSEQQEINTVLRAKIGLLTTDNRTTVNKKQRALGRAHGQRVKSLTAEPQSTQREEFLPNRETTIGQKT